MDRDRERDRDRDRRDDRFSSSNTYRPRSPTGSRIDSYRSTRSPPRNRSPPPRNRSPPRRGVGLGSADTYVPGDRASRPRSRSPAFRRRSRSPRRDDDRWRSRPRSPPRRAYSPRRDDYRIDRARSPPPRREYDSYTVGRSPRRDRSPPPRERDPSPARSRDMRSPRRGSRYEEPRSRAQSPPRRYSPLRDSRDYRRRSPSPRRDRADPYVADTWRRRSPSPARAPYASNDAPGRDSAATSRRSSPPIHPSRAGFVADDRQSRDIPMRDAPMRDVGSIPRSPYRERERERERDRERDRDRDYARDRSPAQHSDVPPSGLRGERDRDFVPPSAPSGPSSSYRNGDNSYSRAPPTGPSTRTYPSPAMSPPGGQSSSGPPPSYPRSGSSNPVLAAPTRPRGGGRGGFGYDSSRDISGAPRRGSEHWAGRGSGRGGYFAGGLPPGPRGSGNSSASFAPPFRGSSNSTSTTYPRTQRFRDHLADLPKEIPGGQRTPDVYDKSKILKLEEEARKLRELIEQKEAAKRQGLKEWDALERDASAAALRVGLADEHLRGLNGEGEVGGAAF